MQVVIVTIRSGKPSLQSSPCLALDKKQPLPSYIPIFFLKLSSSPLTSGLNLINPGSGAFFPPIPTVDPGEPTELAVDS